ncbi:MAG: spore germination protein [Firmicutes bacterium]|nr:spore germination protein [Bacillota bacterium]
MPVLRFWKRLRSIVTRPKRDLERLEFSLGDRPRPAPPGTEPRASAGRLIGGAWPGQRTKLRPDKGQGEPIPPKLEDALNRLADLFHYPQSQDVVFRKFMLYTTPPSRGFILYYDGLADTKRVEREILYPLMRLPRANRTPKGKLPDLILNTLLPAGGAERKETIEEIVAGVVVGEVALLLEPGCAILVDVKNPPARQPSEPVTERTVRGPQVGFTENHRVNTAMVRACLHDPDLVLESFTLGRRTRTPVSMMYICDLANPRLVGEMRRRLTSIDIDAVVDSGTLEKLIEDHPISLIPTVLTTERPDRVCFLLAQGAVCLIVGSSTRALVAPLTFASLLHSAEDVYLRFTYASFLRLLRLAGIVAATLLPGLYIGLTNYHAEMIPNQLLITLTAARENIPFPLILSLLFLEVSFELIRETGIRIPSAIGPTIGIVGALLIGDMAVRATLVSPVEVIIIALTALAGFAIPDHPTGMAARILRFFFIFAAGFLGFFGLSMAFFILAVHLATIRSFGVPFLSPIGPWRAGSQDVILRSPIWDQEKRPIALRPLDLIRQARYARAWDPGTPNPQRADERGYGGPGPGESRTVRGKTGSEDLQEGETDPGPGPKGGKGAAGGKGRAGDG